jgi:hypothetical protein
VQIVDPRKFDKRRVSIRAELSGSDTCSALGSTAKSESPVLALCRQLVDADPATPLEAYRGDTLCLRIRSIGEAAGLRMSVDGAGRPVFRRERSAAAAAAAPVHQTDKAARETPGRGKAAPASRRAPSAS